MPKNKAKVKKAGLSIEQELPSKFFVSQHEIEKARALLIKQINFSLSGAKEQNTLGARALEILGCQKNWESIIKISSDHKLDISIVARSIMSLIHYSNGAKTAEVIRAILENLGAKRLEDLKNYKDLSLALESVIADNTKATIVLKEKGFDFHEKMPLTGLSPLELAVLYHHAATARVISEGAGRDVGLIRMAVSTGNQDVVKSVGGGAEAQRLARGIKNDKSVKLPKPKESQNNEWDYKSTPFDEIISEFFSAIFAEDVALHGNKLIQLAMKFLEDNTSSQSASAAGAKELSDPNLILVLYCLTQLNYCYKFSEDESLKLQLVRFGELVLHEENINSDNQVVLAGLYTSIAVNLINISKSESAFYSQKAIALHSPASPLTDNFLGASHYNLGLALKYTNPTLAFDNFFRAEELLSDNVDAIKQQWVILTEMTLYNRGLSVVDRMPQDISAIYKLRTLFFAKTIPLEKLLQEANDLIVPQESSDHYFSYLQLLADINEKIGDYRKAVEYVDLGTKHAYKSGNIVYISDSIKSRLELFIAQNQALQGIEYLESHYLQAPELKLIIAPSMLYSIFRLHELVSQYDKAQYDRATLILNELTAIECDNNSITMYMQNTANEIRFATEIERENYQEAELLLPKIESYNKDSAIKLLNILKAKQAAAEEQKIDDPVDIAQDIEDQNLDIAIIDTVITNSDSDKAEEAPLAAAHDEADSGDIWLGMDPRSIHAYFQNKKSELAHKKPEELQNKKELHASWQLSDGTKYNSAQEGIVYKIKGAENFYAVIADSKMNLDPAAISAATAALEKGRVKPHCKPGVKFLTREKLEIKMSGEHGDLRLWSNKLYQNSDGKYLAIFDKHGNHPTLNRGVKTKVNIIKVLTDKDFIHLIPQDSPTQDHSLDTCSTNPAQHSGLDEILTGSPHESIPSNHTLAQEVTTLALLPADTCE